MTTHRADVVVVGGGPAGIAAATRAAESGVSVLLVDEAPRPGGQIWRHVSRPPRGAAARWMARLRASNARVLSGTTVVDAVPAQAGHAAAVLFGERAGAAVRIEAAGALVVATGARELLLPFPGWTLPGVIGIGGAQALLKSGWSVGGKRVVIAGSGPLSLPVAATLARAGADVVAVAEQVPARELAAFAAGLWRSPGRLLDAVRYRAAFARTPYLPGTRPVHVEPARGGAGLRAVLASDDGERVLDCDVLCTGFGLVPGIELPLLLGCAVSEGAVAVDELQRTSVDGVLCAGEPTGIGGVDAAIVEGEIAGLVAGDRIDAARALVPRRDAHAAFARRMARTFALRPALASIAHEDTIVCRCEDVTSGDIDRCGSLREAKLMTRAGMGACQGRVCGPALSFRYGWARDSVRPPLAPVSIDTLSRFTDSSED